MLQHAKGNLIDMAEQGMFDIIVHGCNCQNTMGSGIAKEIRARYPGVYQADTLATQQWRNPVAKLGNFSTYTTIANGHPFVVINAYTQLHYLPRGIDHFEYESFYIILKKLESLGGVRFGFPYIGMGLAGGNGFRIQNMLEAFAAKIEEKGGTVTLVEFNG
jgi:O-acetyl-ADP-ribose deacetylase (regulator of RNase III)